MTNKIYIYFVLLICTSCVSYTPPPATPLPTDIQAIHATINNIDIPVKDYYIYGTAIAARNCVGWFSDQIASASRNSALSSELGLLGTAAGVAGGPVGAGMAAAAGFGVSTLTNVQTNSAVGIDPIVTYSLVRKVQQAWLDAAPAPMTKAEAYFLVEDFAEKCQLPDIKKAINDAVSTAPVRAISSFPLLGRRQTGTIRPPVIVIGNQP